MPVISVFYGLIIRMYDFDTQKHQVPHIHVQHGDQHVEIQIPDGKILGGVLKSNKLKLVSAWIEIHQDELLTNWQLATGGQKIYSIEPLR